MTAGVGVASAYSIPSSTGPHVDSTQHHRRTDAPRHPAEVRRHEVSRDVEEFLARTHDPFHRAMLKNYCRHLLLEISSHWDQILVAGLTGDEPEYRIGGRGRTIVTGGHAAVEEFYRTTFE
jgi:hypothetical protein